jgi:peptidoglycan hydrolase-like protein with peptidoglycan-binding domain
MTRKIALVAGVLLSTMSAGRLVAQSSASKPSHDSTMQHSTSGSSSVKLMSHDSTKASASARSTVRKPAWTKDQIKQAQEGLAKGGYYKGQPSGVYDRRTRNAIRAYQKANKLPVTGRLNNDLLTKLETA